MDNINQPVLSICIPTYNRADILKKALERFTQCEGFDDSIEIVVSDNASTDDTQEIAQDYSARFSNIKYFRNDENIKDSNFELALRRGSGKYLKLQNDASLFNIDAFVYMKNCIQNSDESIPIFFTNDFIYTKFKHQKEIVCNSFNEYVGALSTYVTAISCFGVWKSMINNIKDFTKYTELKLNQDDWSYQLLEKYGGCILYNSNYYEGIQKKSGGYHWFLIHLDNYYKIMQPYMDRGLISESVLRQDKKYLLKHFLPELKRIYVYPISHWKFEKKGTFSILWKYYKNEWYFILLIISYPIALIILNPIHYAKLVIKYIYKYCQKDKQNKIELFMLL